ncbi:TPA: hypothetical protein AB5H75_004022 [Vibrio mimicus]
MKEQVSEKCGLLPSELKEDMLFRVFRELSIVKDNTRLLVLVTNGFMELLINRLIETKTKNAKKIKSNGQSFPYATKLLILNEINVISNESYEVFEWFRKLRNNSAHSPVFEVTKNDLKNLSYEQYHDPSDFYNLCTAFIGSLWNNHVDVFGPVFAPGVVGNREK